MPFITVGDRQIEVDEQGYLIDLTMWDCDVAKALAQEEGISVLTEEHWKIINYFREYYLQNEALPLISRICNENKISLKRIYQLFPAGPAKGACKIAGLPRPRGCV